MKTVSSKTFIVLLLVSALFICGVAPAKAQPHKTYFSGCEPQVGEPTGGTIEIKDGRFIFKDIVFYLVNDFSDPRVRGNQTMTVSGNLDLATFTGPFHATGLIVNDGGEWVLHGVGRITPDGAFAATEGVGRGGYAGMVFRIDEFGPDTSQLCATGYIIDAP